ncbi:MAG: guanylate kinase [Candidatus Cloacimonetes bacterium]|nr:guanylate kinase [Candidatus Cloacimonadota bacterium]
MHHKRSNILVVLIAPSGGGKTTIIRRLLTLKPNLEYSVSFTTRQPRGAEQNKVDYHFITEAEFRQKIADDDFIEHALVHNHFYGTSKKYIQERLDDGKDVIMDIDVQGAKQLLVSGFPAVTIFILPPTLNELGQRLQNRKTDTEEVINLRLRNAREEIKKIKEFDYLVINDTVDQAVEAVGNIMDSERNRVDRYRNTDVIFFGG